MIKLPDELPLEKHHTMEIVDSSKIQSFMDCPRGFFFNYVLGLRQDESNIHLVFGSAWHDAMETLLLEGYSDKGVKLAYLHFIDTFRKEFPDPMTDGDFDPKSPSYAYKAIQQYAKQYETDNFEVLYTETAGLVPVRDDRSIAVKLDSIIRDLNVDEVNSLEHKTTGRNSAPWRDSWSIMLQPESYSHFLYMLFPDEFGKVIINGSVFTKSRGWEGVRIPVYKSKENMRAYLWTVNHWIDQIEWNYEQLALQDPESDVMEAFPINCMSCAKFGCRTGGLCSAFPNPLKRFTEIVEEGGEKIRRVRPPAGFKQDYWDPLRPELGQTHNKIVQDDDGKLHIVKHASNLQEGEDAGT